MILAKYSFGIGDRFAHQARAQLKALQMGRDAGIEISPVWNKSYREHMTIGSESKTTRIAADAAVNELNGWVHIFWMPTISTAQMLNISWILVISTQLMWPTILVKHALMKTSIIFA